MMYARCMHDVTFFLFTFLYFPLLMSTFIILLVLTDLLIIKSFSILGIFVMNDREILIYNNGIFVSLIKTTGVFGMIVEDY